MTKIEDRATVLFQGDSITDFGRNREDGHDLGSGYAMMASAIFSSNYPEKQVKFINRGIGGNRVTDLQQRWEQDCLDLNPTWVSIYIGINDTWRRYSHNDPTSVETFTQGYRNLIEQTKEKLDAKLVLIEPFVLPLPEDSKQWREDLDPKINAVRELAREYHALLVPLDGLFAAASVHAPPAFWTTDGVHPSPAGHALIAKAWLDAVNAWA
ncbi:SGNH/GDSL hydrolase family protein [Paenibacillus whitsoniae]|uniref:GDSL family lipase n=1 Tax=Paenibacillus whitsoniae TaxID=2496558 RepID=A0A430JIK4_9BACL|nr:SGNH/GDSL hydrolase family protein [Paenibacillus whitsoniae]RTE10850.1 GDSL family lipase [Paenibacillus whitsoniae]